MLNFPAVPVTAQGLPNGEAAALQHAAYPGMQPFPGVGEWFRPPQFTHCLYACHLTNRTAKIWKKEELWKRE